MVLTNGLDCLKLQKDEALKRKDAELAEAKELIAKLQAQVSK